MTSTVAPEVIIIGDSHAIALKGGCDSLGIPAAMLSVPGPYWHAGRVAFDSQRGIRMRGNARLAAEADQIRESFDGSSVLRRDVPVLVSAGFNIGRIASRFATHRHVVSAEEFASDEHALHVSAELVRGYVASHRDFQVRQLRRLARNAPVTVVPPPFVFEVPTAAMIYEAIAKAIRDARLRLHEPLREDGKLIDRRYLKSDGYHGNEDYGRAAIAKLVELGVIGPKPA